MIMLLGTIVLSHASEKVKKSGILLLPFQGEIEGNDDKHPANLSSVAHTLQCPAAALMGGVWD